MLNLIIIKQITGLRLELAVSHKITSTKVKEKTCGDCNFILAMWGKLWCGIEGQVIKRTWLACKHFKRARNFEEKNRVNN